MPRVILNYWPVVLTIEDCYVPEAVPHVLNAIAHLDEATTAAMFACEAYAAEMDAQLRQN